MSENRASTDSTSPRNVAGRAWSVGLAGLAVTAALVFLSLTSGGELPAAEAHHTYLDVHHFEPGEVTAEAVAEAHQKDLEVQGELGVDYRRYWVDEKAGRVFCLVDAPSAGAAEEVHRRAHGLVADEIHEVEAGG